MYIAGSFQTVRRAACGGGTGWIDNDPHFWTQPPTWGICRNDLRRKADPGDYIFFVLPRNARHPQSIFAYLCIDQKISHYEAFKRRNLRSKRMGNKSPNGNIIVDETGSYNQFDADAHRHMFERVVREYVVGNSTHSRLLAEENINELAPDFLNLLRRLFGGSGSKPFDFITRYGRQLSANQVRAILQWINR